MNINKGLVKHFIFLIGYATALWGSFEQALQAGNHPIWSGTWGMPFPHHYIVGFILIGIAYFAFTKDDWMIKDILEEFQRFIDENQ